MCSSFKCTVTGINGTAGGYQGTLLERICESLLYSVQLDKTTDDDTKATLFVCVQCIFQGHMLDAVLLSVNT